MDNYDRGVSEALGPGRLVLPSLVVTRLALGIPPVFMGLLLIEIGTTFQQSVGAVGQITMVSSVVSVVGALLMGFLSIRYRHKHLLLVGMVLFALSTVGCAFSNLFPLMVAFYALSGLGIAMGTPMIITMVGELYPISKRASAMGYVMAGVALAFMIGAPAITFISGFGGWRAAFLAFVFPLAVLGTVMSYFTLPSITSAEGIFPGGRGYSEGFKEILRNRSAVVCLLGSALNEASWQAIILYGISFMRQVFHASTGFSSMFIIGGALIYTIGSVVSGRIIDRFGRKRTTVATSVLAGAFITFYFVVPDVWISTALAYIACLFTGVRSSANTSLTLEQTPAYRGTMMSVNTGSWYLGTALGAGLGGLMLHWYDYGALGVALGGAGVAASILFQLLAKDPTLT
jgi:predicted MFS family arabinose efflux permease